MITATIGLLLLVQAPQQDASATKTSASQLMSKMFSHYAAANSLVGTVKMTQSANGVSVHVLTELQFDRPSKLYIHQYRDGSNAKNWYITSDANVWSYDRPDNRPQDLGKDRYVEYVTQHANDAMTLPRFLEAASHSLGDVNPMLVSAISSPTWLKRLTGQWATLTYKGKVTIGDQSVNEIDGDYRQTAGLQTSGEFAAFVTDDGDFVKYIVHERWAVPKHAGDVIEVSTVWESSLKIGAATNPNLYKPILPH